MATTQQGLPEEELHARVQKGLFVLSVAIADRIDSGLPPDLQPTWRQDFSTSPQPIARGDLSALIRLLQDPGPFRKEARDAFGQDAFRRLDAGRMFGPLRALRNGAAHPDGWTTREAEFALSSLAQFAKAADMPCAQEIWEIRRGLTSDSKSAQQILSASEVTALQARLDEYQRLAGTAAEERDALVQHVEKQDEQIAALQVDTEQARQRSEALERALESSELDAVERRRLEQELLDARADRDRHMRRVAEAESRSQEVEYAFTQAEQERLDAQAELLRLNSELALERERADRAVAESDDHAEEITVRINALDSQTAQILALIQQYGTTSVAVAPDAVINPGDAWPYEHGDEAWRLSKLANSMTRISDDVGLDALVGAGPARRLVDAFLAIRPTGGRVWIDDDGDACTRLNGRDIYLGNINDWTDNVTVTGPPVGTPMEPDGRRYTLHRAEGVECSADGRLLRDVINRDVANRVRDRLLQVRPKGGRIRVARTGAVTTYVDGQWVYAGAVTPQEWFPGHLK